MMRKNGSSALKSSRSVIVVVRMGPVYVHACAVRRGEASELDRRRSSDLLDVVLGREPIPEAKVSVNIRSISPYSAGRPASTLPLDPHVAVEAEPRPVSPAARLCSPCIGTSKFRCQAGQTTGRCLDSCCRVDDSSTDQGWVSV